VPDNAAPSLGAGGLNVAMAWRRDQLSYLIFLSCGTWVGVFILVVVSRLVTGEGIEAWMVAVHVLSAGVGFLLTPLCWLILKPVNSAGIALRVALLSACVLSLTGLHAVANAYLWVWFLDRSGYEGAADMLGGAIAIGLFRYFLIYAFIVTGLGLLRALRTRDERDAELARARAAGRQAKLAALRLQLNPHFLFNALNAISSLVVTGRSSQAETMIDKLADFLRMSLTADPEQQVLLEEEIEAAEAYLDIEAVRFGERLVVEINCPMPLLKAAVPSFILQPLVENAVKYAVAATRCPVTVSISAAAEGEDLILTVADTGAAAEAQPVAAGTGIGLTNVRSRLHAFYGAAATIACTGSGSGFVVVLRLPLQLGLPNSAQHHNERPGFRI